MELERALELGREAIAEIERIAHLTGYCPSCKASRSDMSMPIVHKEACIVARWEKEDKA